MIAPAGQSGSGGAAGSCLSSSQKDRRTDFDRRQSRAWELVVMELGELLYNKSEYIETVRVARHLPSPLQARVL